MALVIEATLALLLLLLSSAFFLFTAAAHTPSTATTAYHVQYKTNSVLKLPTDANSTVLGEEEACCDRCGACTKTLPPRCNCDDVLSECPSWCSHCEEVEGGKVCKDNLVNYCKNNCRKNEICCDKCGRRCTQSLPPMCNCDDVLAECPSWCKHCEEVEGGKVCKDLVVNYCKNSCRRKERCCNKCGRRCTQSFPPMCNCDDVLSECPSWCSQCEEAEGGKVCVDLVVNYCDKKCY